MYKGQDEMPHEVGSGDHWQENYLFHGWDSEFQNGIYVHIQFLPKEGIVDVRAGASVNGEMTSHVLQAKADNAFDIPGMKVEVVEPFKKFRLKYEGMGQVGRSADGWYFTGLGDVAFGFEVEMDSAMEPVCFLDFFNDIHPDDPTGAAGVADHYEMGMTWSGKIWSAGAESENSVGLGWRDHSWGARDFHTDQAFWTPMVLDGGKTFVAAVNLLSKGQRVSFCVESTAGEPQRISPEYWARADGPLEFDAFATGQSLGIKDGQITRYDFAVERFVPSPRNWTVNGHSNRGLVDVVSRVTSNGRHGIGTLQFSPYVVKQTSGEPANG